MNQKAWEEIEQIYQLKNIDQDIVRKFQALKDSGLVHTKSEGNPYHYCSFFLPYDMESGKIYLGHHIKADDWIPPGGHTEEGETPSDTAVREMKEELQVDIAKSQLTPFALSVKEINRPHKGCMAHYDVWHLVAIKEQNFDYLRSEYHEAGWFGIKEGIAKIAKNPDFAAILSNHFHPL